MFPAKINGSRVKAVAMKTPMRKKRPPPGGNFGEFLIFSTAFVAEKPKRFSAGKNKAPGSFFVAGAFRGPRSFFYRKIKRGLLTRLVMFVGYSQ